MPPRRKLQAVEPQPDTGLPQLEEPDQRIRIVMGQWGNATERAMAELRLFAPGWAEFLQLTYNVVDAVMRGDQ